MKGNEMKRSAFISRHAPSAEQIALAGKSGMELIPVGDRDGFAVNPSDFSGYDAIVVVHAASAIRLFAAGQTVGVFNNTNRAAVGQPPQFSTTSVTWFTTVGHSTVEVCIVEVSA